MEDMNDTTDKNRRQLFNVNKVLYMKTTLPVSFFQTDTGI